MPEHSRPFARSRSGLLALALTVALGDPHALLALRAPAPHTASVTASAEERDASPRRGSRRAPCPRTPRWPRSIIPHPRCHFD